MREILTPVLLLFALSLLAQPSNDDCAGAINIPSVNDYCSGNAAFSNLGGGPDATFPDVCFINYQNGVWFSFSPSEPAIVVELLSGGEFGDLQDPKMVLFSGSCGNLQYIDCSPGRAQFEDEFTVSDLTIGARYYLYVESGVGLEGSFKLCINDFIPQPSPQSDCPEAVILCDKSSFQVESLTTAGNDPFELNDFPNACLSSEFNSSWYKWTCDQPGSLTFTLTPNNYVPGFESDDLDFALFELPNGLDDCDNKLMIRCMASGANGTGGVTDPFPTWQQCNGPTGLSGDDLDVSEFPGCQPGNNNFAEQIIMESGKSYALVVMNFSRSGLGFSIDFGGTGTFLGPEPDFDLFTIDDYECDKRIEITNTSQSLADPIVNYGWNFGLGAEPQAAQGEGPHEIIYESFGNKSIALTVETARGCVVTKIVDIDIEACCADTSTLDIIATATDISCFGAEDGTITVDGISGAPEYNFQINSDGFIPNTQYSGLAPGVYDITVQDIKGCEETTTVIIEEPVEIEPDAGMDISIELGYSGQLNANYTPMNPGDIIEWSPPDGLSCIDCLNPEVTAPGTTTYTLTVTDENGCTGQDAITVRTEIVRELYFPNVITPDTGDANSIFSIGLGPQAELIEEFCVFDRWGNIIFICQDIEPNDTTKGWDGRFGRCGDIQFTDVVNPGVYVWTARIRFIDDEVITYANDVTVLK
jgi:hypothetical protein